MNEAFNALAVFGAIVTGMLLVIALVGMILAGLFIKDHLEMEKKLEEMNKSAVLVAESEEVK